MAITENTKEIIALVVSCAAVAVSLRLITISISGNGWGFARYQVFEGVIEYDIGLTNVDISSGFNMTQVNWGDTLPSPCNQYAKAGSTTLVFMILSIVLMIICLPLAILYKSNLRNHVAKCCNIIIKVPTVAIIMEVLSFLCCVFLILGLILHSSLGPTEAQLGLDRGACFLNFTGSSEGIDPSTHMQLVAWSNIGYAQGTAIATAILTAILFVLAFWRSGLLGRNNMEEIPIINDQGM